MTMTGNYMKHVRVRKSLNASGVSKRMGFSRPSLSKWENGNALPSEDVLQAWATAINLSPQSLAAVLNIRSWEVEPAELS